MTAETRMSAANEPRERSGAGAPASERAGGSGGAKPPGQIIDSHQHFWRYDAVEYAWLDDAMAALRRDFLPPDLAREMAAAHVDASIVVQTRQTRAETDWLLELAGRHASIAGVIGWVDLQSATVAEELERVARHPRLAGVRHIVQGSRTAFSNGRHSVAASRA